MPAKLIYLLTPWRRRRRSEQLIGYLSLTNIVLCVASFFSFAIFVLLLALLAIQLAAMPFALYYNWRSTRHNLDRLGTILLIAKISNGTVNYNELPADQQEAINRELATHHYTQEP